MTGQASRNTARATAEDLGSASLELVVLAPALLLLLSLLIFGARTRMAETSVDQAAGQAARAASLARTASAATRDAEAVASAVLQREGLVCDRTEVHVDTGGFRVPVGTPARVWVQVSCRGPFSDLALPGVPGARTVEARAVSVLDTYRERS